MSPEKDSEPDKTEKTAAGAGKTGRKTGKMKTLRKAADFIPDTPGAAADSMSVQTDDPLERQYFRRALLVIGGAFLVMMFFFTVFFFLAVRGAEKTVIPDIVEKDLVEALVMLQERELYPRVQVKYTGDPSDKGMVIDQDPEPGLYVKAGRRVIVTVSKGAIVDNVEDYVGKNLTDVRSRLASLFSTFKPLLVIREPVTYVYDDSDPGTVLSQTPAAGTPLGDPEDLILIVSRGALDKPVRTMNWDDYSVDNAMRSLARIPLPFIFVEDDSVPPRGTAARVFSQSPPPDVEVGLDQTITLKYSRPESWPEGFRYGLFDYTLPEYPVPVLLEVIIREPGTDDRKLFSMPHSGGRISFPYVVPVGTGIVVMVNGKEITREDITAE